jgi:hypothetical protein
MEEDFNQKKQGSQTIFCAFICIDTLIVWFIL